MKAKKVVAVKDDFMENGEQFCIKGKEYPVVSYRDEVYAIKSEISESHWFDYDNEWFEFVGSEGE